MQLLRGGVTCHFPSKLKIWLNTSNMMYVVLCAHHGSCLLHFGYATEGIFFSSLVISLFDYTSCQRLVLLKNSYLGIPQPNPNLPRWSLALCVWMSVFISQPRDRVVLGIVLKEEREFLDSLACFCLWLCSLLCFLDCTLSSSLTPTTPACESGSTVKTLKYTYDLLTTP